MRHALFMRRENVCLAVSRAGRPAVRYAGGWRRLEDRHTGKRFVRRRWPEWLGRSRALPTLFASK
jgi:hypothetical protein